MTNVELNSVIGVIVSISVTANAFFLKGVARRIDEMDKRQRDHGDRIVWLEARDTGHPPRRRAGDMRNSGDHFLPEEG